MKRLRNMAGFALLLAGLAACSSQQLYRAGQDIQRQRCLAGPPSSYELCMENADLDYESFQKARDADSAQ